MKTLSKTEHIASAKEIRDFLEVNFGDDYEIDEDTLNFTNWGDRDAVIKFTLRGKF